MTTRPKRKRPARKMVTAWAYAYRMTSGCTLVLVHEKRAHVARDRKADIADGRAVGPLTKIRVPAPAAEGRS